MKLLTISLISIFALPTLADTFIDQVDGPSALVCSDESGEWVCKAVPQEILRGFGWEGVEGVVPVIPHVKEYNDDVVEPDGCGCQLKL